VIRATVYLSGVAGTPSSVDLQDYLIPSILSCDEDDVDAGTIGAEGCFVVDRRSACICSGLCRR
jgi:hypothetical protein